MAWKIVFPPVNPDLDGIACAVAYAELLSDTEAMVLPWYSGRPDAEARWALANCGNPSFASEEEVRVARDFVLVDGSELEAFPGSIDRRRVVEVIDHRIHSPVNILFPHAVVTIEAVGAAATLIAERFEARRVLPTWKSGFLLYGAIYSNTQQLQGSVATMRDRLAFSWLEDHLGLHSELLTAQFEARKEEILRDVEGAVVRESKRYYFKDGSEYVISQLELGGAEDLFRIKIEHLRRGLSLLGSRSMLNLVDLTLGTSRLFVPDCRLRAVLQDSLGHFDGESRLSQPVVLRKQIVSRLCGLQWPNVD